MKTITITISKTHYEPEPRKVIISQYKIAERIYRSTMVSIIQSIIQRVRECKRLWDNPEEWNYEIASALIVINHKPFKIDGNIVRMPYWNNIYLFISYLKIALEEEEYEYDMALDAIGGDWEG